MTCHCAVKVLWRPCCFPVGAKAVKASHLMEACHSAGCNLCTIRASKLLFSLGEPQIVWSLKLQSPALASLACGLFAQRKWASACSLLSDKTLWSKLGRNSHEPKARFHASAPGTDLGSRALLADMSSRSAAALPFQSATAHGSLIVRLLWVACDCGESACAAWFCRPRRAERSSRERGAPRLSRNHVRPGRVGAA